MGDRQPSLNKTLVDAARKTATRTGLPPQAAATWVHAAAVAQHAALTGLIPDGLGVRAALDQVAALHPGLQHLADLPPLTAPAEAAITALWDTHDVHDPDDPEQVWWTYPLGDLYPALSDEARAGRALCQTPWFVGGLLLHTSLDRAKEVWDRPTVIDPACGTGHLLLEALVNSRGIGAERGYPALFDRIYGVDLDPYAATIARYRLLVMAWAQLQHRHDQAVLTDLPLHVAAADTLLAVDEPLLAPGRYHVVVANPPYITCKNAAANAAIRDRHPEVCNGKYSLALPFHAAMMRLLVPGGWCAQLTTNSFMKREFGKRYIEKWLPQFDMQWVIDTSGAYLPGHGTPTVIMVHRNQPPAGDTVRTVLGKRGEPTRPANPANGLVWRAIEDAVRRRESAERFGRGAEKAWRDAHPQPASAPVPAPRPVVATPTQPTLFDLIGDVA